VLCVVGKAVVVVCRVVVIGELVVVDANVLVVDCVVGENGKTVDCV